MTHLILTAWQKKQAALLYHFSSSIYFEGLRDRVRAFRAFAEGLLDTSRAEGRDGELRSRQWGNRNTTENWENNAWPFLADFQRSVVETISNRMSNVYSRTSVSQCARGMSEFSMQWSTLEEEEKFNNMFSELYQYARYIDQTMDRNSHAGRWTDFGLTLAWQSHAADFPAIPRFLVRSDLVAESGQLPPKTGVYVSVDDPAATLQFAWTGSADGKLLDGTTFNEIGKAALLSVGRPRLWTDGDAMLHFVLGHLSNPALLKDPFFAESQNSELAPTLVARNAFTSRPSQWCYVEVVKDEFEPVELEMEDGRPAMLGCEAGEECTKNGFYFSPADANSRRYVVSGQQFPALTSDYGKTIWQWDEDQNK